jgi:hypothetical protein
MTHNKSILYAILLGVAFSPISTTTSQAQVFAGDTFRAETSIISAGSRASAVSRLKSVPSLGVVNLAFRTVPRFRTELPDVSEYRISAEKNYRGVNKLRAALRANPVTRNALANRGISVNRVVGVDISSNGSLRLYIL